MSGSDHDSRYRWVYSSKSAISVARRLRDVPPRLDEGSCLRRHLVCVDLVTEQDEPVRPSRRVGLEFARVCPERVHAQPCRVVRRRRSVRGALRRADPARAEDQQRLALVVTRVNGTRRTTVGRRPGDTSIHQDFVRRDGAGLQFVDDDQRVMVARDMERSRAPAEHVHLRRSVRLYPDRRGLRAHIAQQRSKNQGGRHHAIVPARQIYRAGEPNASARRPPGLRERRTTRQLAFVLAGRGPVAPCPCLVRNTPRSSRVATWTPV